MRSDVNTFFSGIIVGICAVNCLAMVTMTFQNIPITTQNNLFPWMFLLPIGILWVVSVAINRWGTITNDKEIL